MHGAHAARDWPRAVFLAEEMRLDYALLADRATLTHDKKLVVLGGDIDAVTVGELPSLIQISLVARVVFDPGESREGHTFGLVCVTPGGDTKPVADGIPLRASTESEKPGARILIDLTIVFSEDGEHVIRLIIDGTEAKSFPFRVKHSQA